MRNQTLKQIFFPFIFTAGQAGGIASPSGLFGGAPGGPGVFGSGGGAGQTPFGGTPAGQGLFGTPAVTPGGMGGLFSGTRTPPRPVSGFNTGGKTLGGGIGMYTVYIHDYIFFIQVYHHILALIQSMARIYFY